MADPSERLANRRGDLLLAACAAFCTYFCMYAFRKPFTAGTFDGQSIGNVGLKTVLVMSQLTGYMLSKFLGIKFVSEMPSERRGMAIVGLILFAELALVGFAFAPIRWKILMIFLNGLPLGMVFGLVLAYLEGRKQTEAMSSALCASFIVSSGVVKSVGRWLVQEQGVSEFVMPMLTGAVFLVPLLVSVRLLTLTPPPDDEDRRMRSVRTTMTRRERREFLSAYWPGIGLLVFVYMTLTVVRTIRDDFGVEIWRDMGHGDEPAVFAQSETVVAVCVTALNACAIWIRGNVAAILLTSFLMCGAFAISAVSATLHASGAVSPFTFMVTCGVGLYIPYVAFHTTVFERLIAALRRPGNLPFLMYIADALGYLGYAAVVGLRASSLTPANVLPFFRTTVVALSIGAVVALLLSVVYFRRVLMDDEEDADRTTMPAETDA